MSSAKRLAREILDTRRLALGHATSPQLTSSALDGGQLDITDSDGNRVGGLGLGDDGGFVIDYTGGPKPPKPSPPTVTADAGMFRIEWDGSFVNEGDEGVLATSDTDRVEIHASMDENFVPDRVESFGGAFATLDGGSFTLGPLPEAGAYYFRLVARSKSGQFSEPSDRVEQELAITSIDLEITDAWLTGEAAQNTADGKNSIWRGPDEPEADPDRPFKDGDIWFEMTEDGKSIPNIWDEASSSWVGNDDYRQSEIERVQQELRDDLDAIVVDGSGTKNFYRGTMPTDEESSEGDLWFDSSDKNKPYIYQNGLWVTVRDSFTQPGAGENVFALLDESGSTPNAVDNQWSNVDGYRLVPGAFDTEAKVPAGAPSGTATLRLPLTGSFNSAGEWQITEDDVFETNGLGLGVAGRVDFYSPGAAPTARIVLNVLVPEVGLMEFTQDLEVKEDPFGSSQTHSVQLDDLNLPIVALYPTVYAWSLYLELNVDSVPGNTVGGSVQIVYAVGSKGVADNAITETKISDDSISTPKLQSKVITTDKIATGAITAESGIIGSINAGTITVGEMDGARIKARSVAADRILIGQGGELIPDQYFDSQGAAWGSTSGSAEFSYSAEAAYSNRKYGVKAVPTAGGSTFYFPFLAGDESSPRIDTQADKKYVVEAWVRRTDGDVSNLTNVDMRMYSYSQPSGGALSNGVASGARVAASNVPPNTWVKLTGTWTSPSPAYTYVSPRLTVYTSEGHPSGAATWHLGMVSMKEQAGATLIEGGAISTEHIRTGAITAESGIIGSIDANVITVGKIMGNQLDADAINGKTITGATIRTASSGSRVELTQNGLKQYNSLGATIVDMTSGSFTLQGGSITGSTIKTATSGSRVEINTQGLKQYNSSNEVIAEMVGGSMVMTGILEQTNSISKMQVGPAFAQSVSPGVQWSNIAGTSKYAGVATRGPSGSASLVAQGPHDGSSSGAYGYMSLSEMGNYLTYRGGGDAGNQSSYLSLTPNSYNLTAYDSSDTLVSGLWSSTTGTYLRDTASTGYRQDFYMQDRNIWTGWRNSGGTIGASLYLNDDGVSFYTTGSRRIYLDAENITIPALPGDSGAVALGRKSGRVYYISSARRFKLLEEPITDTVDSFEDRLLSVDAKTWIDKTRADRIADYETAIALGEEPEGDLSDCGGLERIPGVVAEDLEAAGLEMFVTYNDEGETESVLYDRIGPALIPIVRSLRDRIESLEAQLAS